MCYLHLESVCCQLSRWDPKSCHYQWSKPSLELKKQNKPIREIAKTLGVAKTTVWNILKRRNAPVSSATPKDPEDHGKTTVVDDRRILSLVKKTPFTTVARSEHSPGGRCMCVKVNNQERLHQSEYRGFTTRCKPLVSLKNRKARLEFAKRHLKSLHSSGTTSYDR